MGRSVSLILCLILIFSLSVSASAANTASSAGFSANISSNGSCQVTLDLQLHLESPPGELYFPLPGSARGVSLNGSNARTRRTGDILNVDLSGILGNTAGNFPLRIQYTIANAVDYNDLGKLVLSLPILSGFAYPIDALSFTITLPGENQTKPAFTSGYYQQSIEADMTWTYTGNTVSGSVLSQLKDMETLVMNLEVSEEMFPQDSIKQWTVGFEDIAMVVLAVLAALYWLLFLRCAPFLGSRSPTPPEGLTAGQLTCGLTGQGGDLTMMVFSWAQLGYLLIHPDGHGRVLLHKRMEMGNERSGYEVRIFRSLFGKRSIVDGTGHHYATLCRKVAATSGDVRDLYRSGSGNPKLFRILCAGIGLFGGISLGIAIAGDAILGILLIAVLAILGGLSAWFIQDWVQGLHLRNRTASLIALGLCGIWLILGALAGDLNTSLGVTAAQLAAGLCFAYGGRRTAMGRQTACQILGLRRYLRKVSQEELHRICQSDPDYFFSLAPYALALGVGRSFAKRFGSRRLSACPYLTTGMDGHMTAQEWCEVMRRTVSALDERQRRLPFERLFGK